MFLLWLYYNLRKGILHVFFDGTLMFCSNIQNIGRKFVINDCYRLMLTVGFCSFIMTLSVYILLSAELITSLTDGQPLSETAQPAAMLRGYLDFLLRSVHSFFMPDISFSIRSEEAPIYSATNSSPPILYMFFALRMVSERTSAAERISSSPAIDRTHRSPISVR